jgi:hypothetical protein
LARNTRLSRLYCEHVHFHLIDNDRRLRLPNAQRSYCGHGSLAIDDFAR